MISDRIKNRLLSYRLYCGVRHGARAYAAPYRFSLCPTYRCNLRCSACWCYSPLVGERGLAPELRQQEVPYARLEPLLRELLARGTKYFSISGGGEPLLYPQIMPLFRLLKHDRSVRCDINTNFTVATDEIIDTLVDCSVDAVIVSVWAGTAATYAAVHPGAAADMFAKLTADLRRLNELRRARGAVMEVVINHVVCRDNWHEFPAMVEYAYLTGSTQLRFTHVDVVPGKTDALALDASARAGLLAQAERIGELQTEYAGRHGVRVTLVEFDQFLRRLRQAGKSAGQYDAPLMQQHHCYAGWGFFQLFPDGCFNSCCRIVAPRGNIGKDDFAAVWNGAAQQAFRRLTRDLDAGKIARHNLPCAGLCDNMQDTRYVAARLDLLTTGEKAVLNGVCRLLPGWGA